jgi:O-acetylhomoserine (thiol)-lyase
MSDSWAFETKQIHAGQRPDPATGASALPIHQSASYQFRDSEHARALFALEELGFVYSRLMNPTQAVVEDRIAALEGGVGALLVASGQAAETLALLNLTAAGDHIVASPSLYGGTVHLLEQTLPRFGIQVSFVEDAAEPDSWRRAVQPNTKAFYGETLANPSNQVLALEGIAEVAHRAGIPLIVDNTVPTPYLLRPMEWGADIVVHSATKYLGGHGTTIAGAIVDSGRFDFARDPERFADFNQPDPGYNGLVYARDFGADGALGANVAFLVKARVQLLRDLGPAISPFNAWLIAQGLETLSLRMERHSSNALAVARWLEERAEVHSVLYAGLPSHPSRALAERYLPAGCSGLLSFELIGGLEAGRRFIDALELHCHVANIGDVRSLVLQPAATTHSQLSEAQLHAAGVTPGQIRLCVGLEAIDDILADLEKGLRAAGAG